MTLAFNGVSYEFKMIANRLHIYVNGKCAIILPEIIGGDNQDPRSIGPQSLQDCVDLIDYYEL